MGAYAGGWQSAQAGLRVCARGFLRAYLAFHPPAVFGFFGGFPGFERRCVENEEFWCSEEMVVQIFYQSQQFYAKEYILCCQEEVSYGVVLDFQILLIDLVCRIDNIINYHLFWF